MRPAHGLPSDTQSLAVPASTRPAVEAGLVTKMGPNLKKAKGSAQEIAHLASRKDAPPTSFNRRADVSKAEAVTITAKANQEALDAYRKAALFDGPWAQ